MKRILLFLFLLTLAGLYKTNDPSPYANPDLAEKIATNLPFTMVN